MATSPVDERTVLGAILAELQACLDRVPSEAVAGAADEVLGARRLFLAGAGRSALAIRGFAIRLMHMGRAVHVVGEPTTPAIEPGDLLVIGSGSGRTASLLAMAQTARRVGARLMLLTIDPDSPIAALADRVLVIPAPSPKVVGERAAGTSVQPMGSLFEQALLLVLDGLVVVLMGRADVTSEAMFRRHANLE